MSLAFTTIRYGVLTRKFLLPSTAEKLIDVVRREFIIDDSVPLGLSFVEHCEPSLKDDNEAAKADKIDENDFVVLSFDIDQLTILSTRRPIPILDLRVYARTREGVSDNAQNLSPNTVVAQFNFVGDSSRELSFSAGECIDVIQRYNDDWWKGSIGTRSGYFPSNYVSGIENIDLNSSITDTSCNFQDDEYFEGYSNLGIHLEMLKDSARTVGYQNAINRCSAFIKNKIVLDVGCGSSILSVFCAQAGAAHVYAVEASDVVKHARTVIDENNLADKITVICGKIEEIQLPVDKVDIIVSEWMGTLLICESMITSVLFARQKFLKADGLILPSTSDVFLAPICIDEYYNERVGFWDDVYGVKMSSLKDTAKDEFFSKPIFDRIINGSELIATAESVATVNMQTATIDDLESSESAFEFQIARNCTMHGFGGWFDSVFHISPNSNEKSLTLSTSPLSTSTHWKQVMFILSKPLTVEEGTTITGVFKIHRQAFWRRHFDVEITFRVGDAREPISQTFPLWR